ncbi:hypothetical protein ACIBCN_18630 [Nocardia sp. NPDC051052]|uniref:hypothetical protein n=1 Tax=Nocardia sp. NPDC051052 TaxID=3364322 RepID=UPI00378D6158
MGIEDDDDCQGACPWLTCHHPPVEMQTIEAVWRVFRSHETHPGCCRHRKLSMAELARRGRIDPDSIALTREHQRAPLHHEARAKAIRKCNPVKMARGRGHVPEYVISWPTESRMTRRDLRPFLATIRQRFPVSLTDIGWDEGDVMPTQALIIAPPLPALGISLHTNGLQAYLDPASETSAAFITAWYARTFPTPGLRLYHLDTDTTITLTPGITAVAILTELTTARDHARTATIYRRNPL